MAYTRLDKLLTLGTAAERAAFTPDPPSGVVSIWHESDTGNLFAWDGADWVQVNGGGGSVASTDITDSTTVGRAVLTAADAAAARTAIGALAATGGTIADYREARGNVTTTGNITLTLANPVQRIVLDAVRQITAPADPGAVAASLTIILLCQDYTPTWAGITWLTSDGNAPTLNTATGKRNVITLVWDDNGGGTGAWLGFHGGSET